MEEVRLVLVVKTGIVFFKQKTAYEMRISDWSSDVCSSDLYLRRLEAMMAVADAETSLVLTGNGDVLEPEDGLIGIGSGGSFALAAARALVDVDALDAEAIARKAMKIAGDICI